MLQSMGSQRVGHDLETEQQQQHHLYVESKKIQLVNITKKKRRRRSGLTDTENKLVVFTGEENQLVVGQWKVQIIGYEIGYKNILYNTGDTANGLQ